ncbi:MAG: glycosyl hydrolase family 28-related protein [bacterium]
MEHHPQRAIPLHHYSAVLNSEDETHDIPRQTPMLAAAILCCFIWVMFCARGSTETIDVRKFGAKGDGKADDTTAIQRAMETQGAMGGGVAHLPAGHYLVKSHLNIPSAVTLEGIWQAPPTANRYTRATGTHTTISLLTGSVLLAVEGAGQENGAPFITLNPNSVLKGVTIFYPEQKKTNPPIAYPWTVQTAGCDNISIIDVLMINPYQAVDFGTKVVGRHFIRNLYGQPLRRGLFIDLCLDIGRIENIHFWPFWTVADGENSPTWKYMKEHGEAFIFGRSDWEYVTNCFAISYKTGFHFLANKRTDVYAGGGNYLLTQSGADCCKTALLVDDTQGHSGISFSNSQIYGDIIINDANRGKVSFTACNLFGSMDGAGGFATARIDGKGRVTFSNCEFYCIDPKNKANTMLDCRGGRISVIGCDFINPDRETIKLGPDVISAIIANNEFRGKANISNQATRKDKVAISGNIEETGF